MKQTLLLIALIFATIISNAQSFEHSALGFDDNTDDSGPVHSKLSVYPNPSNGNFNVELGDFKGQQITIMVLDINGKMVSYRRIEDCNEHSIINLDLSKSGEGSYFVQVSDGKAIHCLKLLVRG